MLRHGPPNVDVKHETNRKHFFLTDLFLIATIYMNKIWNDAVPRCGHRGAAL